MGFCTKTEMNICILRNRPSTFSVKVSAEPLFGDVTKTVPPALIIKYVTTASGVVFPPPNNPESTPRSFGRF